MTTKRYIPAVYDWKRRIWHVFYKDGREWHDDRLCPGELPGSAVGMGHGRLYSSTPMFATVRQAKDVFRRQNPSWFTQHEELYDRHVIEITFDDYDSNDPRDWLYETAQSVWSKAIPHHPLEILAMEAPDGDAPMGYMVA